MQSYLSCAALLMQDSELFTHSIFGRASGKPAVSCSDSRAEAQLAERKSPNDAYMVQAHGYNVPNFHRIVVHGETMPLEWLKLRVDPTFSAKHGLEAFGPFSWKRIQPAM